VSLRFVMRTTIAASWVIIWAVLAIGAVYGWGYGPMLLGCALVAALEGVRRAARRPTSGFPWPGPQLDGMSVALALLCGTIAIELVPLPNAWLASISPGLDGLLRRHDLGYTAAAAGIAGAPGRHPLSIDPTATARGLMFVAALSAWFLALRSAFRREGTLAFIRAVGGAGVAIALFAIVQRATFNGHVYWTWTPKEGVGNPFGPFINHNHFATFMLLVLSLQLGRLCALAAPGRGPRTHTLRERVVWLASREASELLLTGFGVVIGALALVLSLSRSGICSLVLLVSLVAAVRFRRRGGRPVRALTSVFVAAVPGLAIAWAGLDRVSGRFASIPLEAPFRLGIWEDTARIIRDMPLTGTGFNTFGVASPYYQTTDLSLHFAEAHNDYLQLASEGGLFLLILAASVLVVFCRQIARRLGARADDVETAWTRVGAVAGLVAVAAQSLVEFGLQVPANASLFVAVAALAAHEPRPRRTAYVRPPATG